jgi:hypothetical protein
MVREALCRNPYSTHIPATSALSIFHGRERLGRRQAQVEPFLIGVAQIISPS